MIKIALRRYVLSPILAIGFVLFVIPITWVIHKDTKEVRGCTKEFFESLWNGI